MEHESDFLVIGSGVAGLLFALKVADHGSVTIVTKKNISESNTAYAQGGIASVIAQTDSFDAHIQDTLASGDGICNKRVVEMVVRGAPERIQELIDLGVQFNRKRGNSKDLAGLDLDLCREGGHSHNRIVHADDLTGRAVEEALVDRVMSHKQITLFENNIAIDLLTRSTRLQRGMIVTTHEDYCYGAYVLDRNTNEINTFCAKTIVLATGGAGKVYMYTSNPDIATGDGIAMAYRTGATVANMEFVQFHPTCLYHPDAKNFLISEAVRGDGAILINTDGKPFMENYSPLKDLACRDVVARAIDAELKKRGDEFVFLDITHKNAEFIKTRFPNLYEKCLNFGIDMTADPIPVVPAAHYMCGGVLTDLDGHSTLKGLYVTGEAACTGLHGANRLASNSLLEALVFSKRAYENAVHYLKNNQIELPAIPPWNDEGTFNHEEWVLISHDRREIQRLMWDYVGIVRSDERLQRAGRRIELIAEQIEMFYKKTKVTPALLELRNIATVASLIIRSALFRKESRGLHYTTDYPERDDEHWLGDTVIQGENIELRPLPPPSLSQ